MSRLADKGRGAGAVGGCPVHPHLVDPPAEWLPWQCHCAAFISGCTTLMEKCIVITACRPFLGRKSGAILLSAGRPVLPVDSEGNGCKIFLSEIMWKS